VSQCFFDGYGMMYVPEHLGISTILFLGIRHGVIGWMRIRMQTTLVLCCNEERWCGHDDGFLYSYIDYY
jgi:hypothetical protein